MKESRTNMSQEGYLTEAPAASTSGALASERFAERIQSAQTGGVVDTERVNLLAGRAVKALNDIIDRKSTRLNSSHVSNSYAVFCLKKTIQSALYLVPNKLFRSEICVNSSRKSYSMTIQSAKMTVRPAKLPEAATPYNDKLHLNEYI